MDSLSHSLIVLVVGCCSAVLPFTSYGQTKTATKAATSSVSGRITIRGKAAPGITVGIRGQDYPSQISSPAKAITDQEGNYQIRGIPPGTYQVSPIAPLYVLPDLMMSGGRGATLLLAQSEDVQGIDFELERGGVITGKVTDADGRPVIEERMIISVEGQPKSRGPLFAFPGVQRFQTDDRGIYRIYGIPEGRYHISVGQNADDPNSNTRPGRLVYKQTFYPDTTELDKAKVVQVTEGGEFSNIDITLGRSLATFSASGKIVEGETDQPVIGQRLMLQRMVGDNSFMSPAMSISNSQGGFRLDNVTPGKYMVIASSLPGSEVRTESGPFEVTDQDVTGIVVKTFKGSSISGTLVVEGATDRSILNKVAELRLIPTYSRIERNNSGGPREAVLSPDGSFRIGGLMPGTLNFYLASRNFPSLENFSILRIERDGLVQPSDITIKAGENLTGITVILGYGTGSIRGQVNVENGPLPPNTRFGIWLKKMGETGASTSTNRPIRVDLRGHFLIEGVAAGSYELYVSVNTTGRRSLPPVKRLVTVSDAATTEVDVTVDLKFNTDPQPQP